jgi:beta-glucuronidase
VRSSAGVNHALFALLAVALTVPAAASAASAPQAGTVGRDGPSGRYLLDRDWYERVDPPGGGERAGLPSRATAVGWQPISVPVAVNAGDFSVASYTGSVHWYRSDFELPRSPGGTSWHFRFESVNHRARVWLNGRLLGSHIGAYLPFELPAPSIRRGINHLVVRVDSRRGPDDIPPLAERTTSGFEGGWWNYNGILRAVYLRKVRKLDFDQVFVRPALRCRSCAATVTVDARVHNLTRSGHRATVKGSFGGRPLRFRPRRVAGLRSTLFGARLRVAHPRLWEPGHPHLYKLRLRLLDEQGGTVQRYRTHTGIRSVRVNRRGRIELNGREVNLRGAAIHEDSLERGAALTTAQMEQTFRDLHDLGATITRAHYPLNTYELELADRYGIMVWSEVPVYRMNSKLFNIAGVRARALRMLRELVTRDCNHPSVLVWSVGNENASRPQRGLQRYIRIASRMVKSMDPTRLTGIAISGYPTVEKQRIYLRLDVIGINDYFGWYPGPRGTIADPRGLDGYLNRMHSDFPHQALMVTEFGAEANRHGPATEKGTYEFQADFLAYHLRVFGGKPFINAAVVWALHDFRVKPGWTGGNPLPHPPVNEKGLIDDAGLRKPAFETVRQIFRGTAPFR